MELYFGPDYAHTPLQKNFQHCSDVVSYGYDLKVDNFSFPIGCQRNVTVNECPTQRKYKKLLLTLEFYYHVSQMPLQLPGRGHGFISRRGACMN